MFWKIRKYNVLKFLVLIVAIVVSCFSCKADVSFGENEQSSNLSNLYDDITDNINKDSYNELDWMTEEPIGGIIVYDGYKLYDIDNDGIEELFVLRKYINNQTKYPRTINEVSNLNDFYNYAIRQNFISESYKIVDDKVEPLSLDGDLLMTQAFEGGHFGTYYFLLDNGNIAKFYNSYWEENLVIYENLQPKTTLSYAGEPGVDEWEWKIDGDLTNYSKALEIIKNLTIM
ncbi:MAG: hypothetical protein IJ593_00225 [Lachnospiraceae bacterium]|nr:hypothetical protein [Lachnospiraceae bacterium]